MTKPDWIVVGGGLSGGAIAYELSRRGAQVLVIERQGVIEGPSCYSYGGIAWWSGITPLQRQLLKAGLERQRHLPEELAAATGFRNCDLLLPIPWGESVEACLPAYQGFELQPTVLSPREAQDREPALSPTALEAVLHLPHARVTPSALVAGYRQASQRLGATWISAEMVNLICQEHQISGVETSQGAHDGGGVILATGAATRHWLKQLGVSLPLYFTWAEAIATLPSNQRLQAIIMPARSQRFALEAAGSDPLIQAAWDREQPTDVVPPILDAGAAPLDDQRLLLGQVSRVRPSLRPVLPSSSQAIRRSLRAILPRLAALPGRIVSVAVAYSADQMPFVGLVPGWQNLALFTGFSSPFAYVPVLAQQAAAALTSAAPLPQEVTPERYSQAL